jgi:hypothetical protein
MLSDLELAKKLVRWRANPEKIRVSIQRSTRSVSRWKVTITCRATGEFVTCKSLSPERAIMRALKAAGKKGWDGMDLGMGWAYRHPWK